MTVPRNSGKDFRHLQTAVRNARRGAGALESVPVRGHFAVVLGLAAIIVPPLASLAVTIFIGWMFLISGIGGLFVTFWARQMPGSGGRCSRRRWQFSPAAPAGTADAGRLTLTIVVGAYFLAEGVATIMYALEHRRELSERWSWLLVAGLMDIMIAFLIIAGLPGSAEWAIGLLAGINLLFGGATLIGMALAARKS